MGTNTLTEVNPGDVVQASDKNEINTALTGDFVPRNVTSRAPEGSAHKCGLATTTWLEGHFDNLFIGGTLFIPSSVGVTNFRIDSGETRSTSDQPIFVKPSGGAATVKVDGSTTPLQLTINNESVTITTTVTSSALDLAPSTNNTALVNNASLTGDTISQYWGEDNTELGIDAAGSEITDRIGQWAAFSHGSDAIIFAFIESATKLTNVYRGFFFDDSDAIIDREAISDNDTLTLLNLAWIFVDDTPSISVVYNRPTWAAIEPASPDTGDYWFDMTENLWKSFDGAVWQEVDRILVGLAATDTANCIAARSFDFSKTSYTTINTLEVANPDSVTTTLTKGYKHNIISVYGNLLDFGYSQLSWDITSDLESGLTEASDTLYYLYVAQDAGVKISDKRPILRPDLGGYYHPWQTWRCVGIAYNNSGSDLLISNSHGVEPSREQGNEYFLMDEVVADGTSDELDALNIGKFRNQRFSLKDYDGIAILCGNLADLVVGGGSGGLWARVSPNDDATSLKTSGYSKTAYFDDATALASSLEFYLYDKGSADTGLESKLIHLPSAGKSVATTTSDSTDATVGVIYDKMIDSRDEELGRYYLNSTFTVNSIRFTSHADGAATQPDFPAGFKIKVYGWRSTLLLD